MSSIVCASLVLIPAAMSLRADDGAAGDEGRSRDGKCGLQAWLRESGFMEPGTHQAFMATPFVQTALQAERTIGVFRFHYDTTGSNAPAMLDPLGNRIPGTHEVFVDSAGSIFSEVYDVQTSELGYISPIQPDPGLYDVTISNASPYYGWTTRGTRIGMSTPARYTSTIVVDQDFREFASRGLDGLRVTAAHEFFHAVQFGSYGYWAGDEYFMEITSTWMEDVVYDDINDYYQYIRGLPGPGGYPPRGHFVHPDSSFPTSDGLLEYSRSIFGKFIEKKYSRDVIRRTWELMPGGVAVHALNSALNEWESSFREAFLQWAVWNTKTGPDADTSAFYTEGREYPRIVTAPVMDYTPPSRSISDEIGALSVFYYPVNIVGSTPMSVIVANINETAPRGIHSFVYEMADAGDESYKSLANGLFVRLDVSDPSNWSTLETVPSVIAAVTPAPNPFTFDDSHALNFHIPATARPASVSLTVLRIGMDRVFQGPLSLRDDLSTPFVQIAEWDVHDGFSRPLSSGIYIYILTVDGAEHTGKFSVVR